jgi:hypothetical protein
LGKIVSGTLGHPPCQREGRSPSAPARQLTAARQAISQNWADNAGNRIPDTGGVFNTAGKTIAEVLSTAH